MQSRSPTSTMSETCTRGYLFLSLPRIIARSPSTFFTLYPPRKTYQDVCQKNVRRTHDSITLCTPVGYGNNLVLHVTVANQLSVNTPTVQYNKPLLRKSNPNPYSGVFSLNDPSTVSNVQLTLHGINFGLHPSIADTYNIGTVSHLVVDSPLGLKRSNIEPNGLNILSWNHTTIKFQTPEGDGINW